MKRALMSNFTYLFFFSLLLAPVATIGNTAANPGQQVVATVNGTNITLNELDVAYQETRMFVSNQPVSREKVLNDLINRVLGIERAKQNNLQNDPLVRSRMEDILYHAQISRDLEGELSKITVTDADLQAYYRNFPEYRTAHILFRVRANPEKEEWEAALQEALNVYKQLKESPDKFAEFANRFSQASNAEVGGDMGFQPAARMPAEYFNAINGKPAGHITPPVRTQFGFHLIRMTAVREFSAIDRQLYEKLVYDQKRDQILAKYFEGLRRGKNITINQSLL